MHNEKICITSGEKQILKMEKDELTQAMLETESSSKQENLRKITASLDNLQASKTN